MSSRKNSIIFIGKISHRVHTSDLEDQFNRYGRIKDVDFRKHKGFAFIEYSHRDDANYAIEKMDGRYFEGSRLVVEFKGENSKRGKRDEKHGPSSVDVCFNCGQKGHWANECREGDWKNKCYKCGKNGHVKKDCSRSCSHEKKKKRHKSKSSSNSSSSSSASRSRSRSKDKHQKQEKQEKQEKEKSKSHSKEKSKSSKSGSKSSSKSSKGSSKSRSASCKSRSKSKSRDKKD